jgi:aldose sugar dehydrogenase
MFLSIEVIKFILMEFSILRSMHLFSLVSLLSILSISVCLVLTCLNSISFAQEILDQKSEEKNPIIKDPNLKIVTVVEGLKKPTSMAFLGQNDFLVLEKNTGIVKRIVNGNILVPPVLDVSVANEKERGMLGVAVESKDINNDDLPKVNNTNTTYVYLYYTESSGEDGNDDCPLINYCEEGNDPKGNRLYRYLLDEGKLVDPELLLDLPSSPGSDHLGGSLIIGPDGNIYLSSGDGHSCSYGSCDNGTKNTVLNSKSANEPNGIEPNGRGGIIRITRDGLPVSENGKNGILGEDEPLDKYYAYGIRNSFGIDFDPLTGYLWDTENGPSFGDEINLVEPGFNSGWSKIQGIWPINNNTLLLPQGIVPPYRGYFENERNHLNQSKDSDQKKLVDFDGKGKYSDPEFIWNNTMGVTAMKFFNSDKLGKLYENDLFVGDYSLGRLYHFDLTEDRTGLALSGSLADKIAESSVKENLGQIIFAEGLDAITDIEIGPDGYLYIVSHKGGKVFKIIPSM